MLPMDSANFAGWLCARLRPESRLINAATGRVYADLPQWIGAAAASFVAAGLTVGSRVVVACRQDPETALALLGAMHAGLVPVPVEANDQAAIARLLAQSGAAALWSGVAEHAGLAGASVFLHGLEAQPEGIVPPVAQRQGNDVAVLMSTSGTTGSPRLVMVTHANLTANTLAIQQTQGLGPADCAMLILPLSYCFGTSVLFSHLAVGGSVVLDRRFMFPDKVLHAMAEHGCTTFAGVPSVYQILLQRSSLGKVPMPALRRCLQAGGRLSPDRVDAVLERLPGVDFHVMYGQTEATSRIASLPPEYVVSHRGSVGVPLPGLQVRIVDAHRQALAPMAVGAIEVAGASVCAGYWEDPQASRQRFPDTWLQTGDRGWLDEQGFLWIEGRNDDFLKIRGRRVSFAEIEGFVSQMAGVQEAAVLSTPDAEAGEAPVVFVVPLAADTEDGWANGLLKAMPAAWTCRQVIVLPNMPLNASGKLDRNALRLALVKE